MPVYSFNSKEAIAQEIKKLQQEIEHLQNRQRELEEIPELICVFPESESDIGIMNAMRANKYNPHTPTYIKFEKYEDVVDYLEDIVNSHQLYEEVEHQYNMKNPNYRSVDIENVGEALEIAIKRATNFVMNELKKYRY